MWHAWVRTEQCTRFWWEIPKEIVLLEDQGVDGSMRSEWILCRMAGRVLSEFDWLRIRTSGGLL
jgi:hypothetical protein